MIADTTGEASVYTRLLMHHFCNTCTISVRTGPHSM